ncbi:MAG: four helix bundle protein [Anaerolineales bacterium]
MPLKFEELKILQASETIADDIWNEVNKWDPFTRDVVGKQLTKSVNSIGANIAEAYGRFHFGEKVQFLYFARGSLFETKYWLNRVKERNLLTENLVRDYSSKLSDLARQLNKFISEMKVQQRNKKSLNETAVNYLTDLGENFHDDLFKEVNIPQIDNT